MRYEKAAIAAIAIGLGACSEQPRSDLTDPSARSVNPVNVVVLAACDPAAALAISTSFHDLYVQPQLGEATTLWTNVVSTCSSNIALSRENMLSYVQFTIDKLALGQVKPQVSGTPADAIVAHWNATFAYVGYPAPSLTSAVFGPEGAAGVIKQTTVDREIAAANAAITVPVQDADGDQRGHLFVIYPIGTGCLAGSNLQQSGPCFEFAAFPAVSPVFSPKVKVGICQPVNENDELSGNAPALGHLTGGFVMIPSQTQYPTFCGHADETADAGSWNNGIGGIAKRLAYFAKKAVGVQPLYAVHGGLGGLGGGLSPFGAVDLIVFLASLEAETLGAPPSADAGNWTLSVTPPGSITVQPSLGAYNDTIIVLRQAGGNCITCGGLHLQANLFAATGSSGADLGTYEIRWVSLQDKPAPKNAPLVARGSTGLEIARLAYTMTKNKSILLYNGIDVGSWVRGTPQTFRIVLNLNTKQTSLYIDGVLVAANKNFVQAATDLATFAAEFSGIDSGIVGLAELAIQRLPDE